MLLLAMSLLAASAQASIWQRVSMQPDARPERISVSKQTLIFEELLVSPTEKVMLVEAGPGCARGGQGANGAMWIVRFKGDRPVLLATPQGRFNGWLYSIQPALSHGLHDLVLGWHISARETGFCYFRFDGARYRMIGAASLLAGEEGNPEIVPVRK